MKKLLYIHILIAVCVGSPRVARAQNVSLTEADTLVSRAEKLAEKGMFAESMQMLGDAKNVYKSIGNTKGAEYGRCLHQISYCYFMIDSLDLGLEYALKSAEIRKQALGDTNIDYMMTMNNIGSYYYMTKEYVKSERVYREILSGCLLRKSVPLRYSFFSSNAARVLMAQGKTAQAMSVLDSTIVLVRRDFGDTGKVVGNAALDCANVELAFDNYCRAAEFMEMSLNAYEKFSEAYGQMLEKLGFIYINREMCYDMDKAMRIMNLTDGYNKHELLKECEDVACLTNRAEYYSSTDNIEEAKNTYLKALKTSGTLQEQRDLKISYAHFMSNQKMNQDAAMYYKLAAVDEKQLNGESKLFASTMYMAGLMYNLSRNRAGAVECLTQSSTAYSKLGGDENLRKSYKSLQSVGTAYSIERNFEEALTYYSQAMKGMSRWPQSEEYASSLSDVAKAECNLGYFDSSLVHYRQALQIYENLQMTNEYTNTLQMIQYTLAKAGREEESVKMDEVVNNSIIRQTENVLAEEKENLPMYKSIWGEDGFQYAQALASIAEM